MSHKIGITACSNPMHPSFSADLARLCQILRELGFDPVKPLPLRQRFRLFRHGRRAGGCVDEPLL